jgi:hypothetical protein
MLIYYRHKQRNVERRKKLKDKNGKKKNVSRRKRLKDKDKKRRRREKKQKKQLWPNYSVKDKLQNR